MNRLAVIPRIHYGENKEINAVKTTGARLIAITAKRKISILSIFSSSTVCIFLHKSAWSGSYLGETVRKL